MKTGFEGYERLSDNKQKIWWEVKRMRNSERVKLIYVKGVGWTVSFEKNEVCMIWKRNFKHLLSVWKKRNNSTETHDVGMFLRKADLEI